MKICHLIYIPRLSGAEILVRDLATTHVEWGHQVCIISLEPPEDSFKNELKCLEELVDFVACPKIKLGRLSRLGFLADNIKEFNPDIIVAHSVIPSIYGRIALRFTQSRNVPFITVLHDGSQNDYSIGQFCFLERWVLPMPSGIVALTQKAVDNYYARTRNKVRVTIIPNGINLKHLHRAATHREEIRKQVLKVDPEEPVFLQVGRFNQIKQQHLSISAFLKACESRLFRGKLFLVGLPENLIYLEKLRQVVKESSFPDRIVFLGVRSDVPDLLSAADVYLMPSQQEAHSIAFLEALASGIRIIASDISTFQMGLNFPGVTLIEPTLIDKMSELLSESILTDLKTRFNRDLDDYSIEKTASNYLNLFNSL